MPFLAPTATNFEDLVRWLAWRQTVDLEEAEEGESDAEEMAVTDVQRSIDEKISALPDIPSLSQRPCEVLHWAGFNGRSNKIADTCYSFWVTGTLGVSIYSPPPILYVRSADD